MSIELFVRCGHALCGDGHRWKEQLAYELDVAANTVDNWAKGTSRVPPGVWADLYGKIQARRNVIGALEEDVRDAALEGLNDSLVRR